MPGFTINRLVKIPLSKPIGSLATRWPIPVSLALLAIALLFRLIDIFLLHLDERLGEIILSKILGFALVVLFLWLAGRKLSDIGLHSRGLVTSLFTGASITAYSIVALLGMLLVKYLAKRFALPEAQPPKPAQSSSSPKIQWVESHL